MSRFDKEASRWDKNARRQALAHAVAQGIKRYAPKEVAIFDFGCGTGLVSYNLTDIASSIYGYDTSPKMVEEFNKKSTSPTIKASTQLPSLAFELIVSSMTLHHIQDLEELAQRFAHLLKPQGLLCIADLYKEDGSFHDRGNDDVFHFGFDPHHLAALFISKGFKEIIVETIYIIKKQKEYPIFLLVLQKAFEE